MALPFWLFHNRALAISALVLLFVIRDVCGTTFPLEIPKRPTSFPLQRPTQAGEVVTWGRNDYGQTTVPPNLTNIVAVDAQGYHTLALRNDGTVVEWGQNNNGQNDVPAGLSDVVSVSAGFGYSVALKANGTVVCWGASGNKASTVPAGLTGVVAIAAGASHTLALKSNGTVIAWGSSDYELSPRVWYEDLRAAVAPTNVIKITASQGASWAFLADNRTIRWPSSKYLEGTNLVAEVQTFDGTEFASFCRQNGYLTLRRDGILNPPTLVPLNVRPVAVSQGDGFTIALNGDSSVTCWGYSLVSTTQPPRLRGVFSVAAGYDFAVVVKTPTPPIPTTARAAAQIVNGFIVGMNILDGGEGYATPPAVTITGGGGSGATASSQISKGVVTGFTMTNAGIGYTGTPTVEIEPPPFLPKLSVATSRVGVTMQVVPGKRYQLESSNDLPNFGPVGAPFIADKDTSLQEFVVSETGQFFRIIELP